MTYSIIVAIYNVEEYLCQCLDSILAQTKTEYEVILVDDGSKDACAAICDEYAAKDSRVKVIHKENGGLITARKAGLYASTGEYICFVDGDDFVAPDFLEAYDLVLQQFRTDIVCTGYTAYTPKEEKYIMPKPAEGYYDKAALIRDIYPRMLSIPPFFSFFLLPSVCLKCFRRSLLLPIYDVVPNKISLGEDAAVSYPALLDADSIYILDHAAYKYRQNLDSMTHSYDKNMYEKIKELIAHMKKYGDNKWCNIEKAIGEYISFLIYLAGCNEFFYNKSRSYLEKRRNMMRYLKDEDVKPVLQKLDIRNSKFRIMPFCLKHRLLFVLYLIGRIKG